MLEGHAMGVILTDEQKVGVLEHKVKIFHQLYRETQWKLKLAHKQIGKQGDTIHNLRGNIAELHTLISKESRGIYRRIQDQYDDLYAEHEATLAYVETLEKKLDEQETAES